LEAGFEGTVDNKLANFEEVVGWPRVKNDLEAASEDLEAGKPGLAAAAILDIYFFCLIPFLGFFLIALPAMAAGRRRAGRNEEEWRLALTCFAFFVLACLAWGCSCSDPGLAGDDPRRQPRGAAAGPGRLRCRAALGLPAVRLGSRCQRPLRARPLHAVANAASWQQLLADRRGPRPGQRRRLRDPRPPA
jgi:hypothetical protein